jgi:hypothetical protein
MADSFPPPIAPQTDSSGNAPEAAQQPPEPLEAVPITEQEVGEYREQDRYLPVSPPLPPHSLFPSRDAPPATTESPALTPRGADRQRLAHHEERRPSNGKNREGRQGVRTGVCVGVHQLYHVRSGGEVPAREAQDDRWRGHPLRDGLARV